MCTRLKKQLFDTFEWKTLKNWKLLKLSFRFWCEFPSYCNGITAAHRYYRKEMNAAFFRFQVKHFCTYCSIRWHMHSLFFKSDRSGLGSTKYKCMRGYKSSRYFHSWQVYTSKVRMPCSMDFTLHCHFLYAHSSHRRFFIHSLGKKTKQSKSKLSAQHDTLMLQVLLCIWHLWPQSRVFVFVTKSTAEVEREGFYAVELCGCRPPLPHAPPL